MMDGLDVPISAEELVPPPRFAACTFDTYVVDPAVPGQRQAVDAVKAFATAKGGLRALWRRGRLGLYLDGGFGVGKTHLLAAAWHAARGRRRFLSFHEAISLCVLRGPLQAVELLAGDLVCIDEFELDDPSNTRLADLLLEGLVRRRCRVVTTSNTVPGELGQGRMAVEQFAAQLTRIGSLFEDVHVPGNDWRLRSRTRDDEDPPGWAAEVPPFPAAKGVMDLTAAGLDRLLATVPVINLRKVAKSLSALRITGLDTYSEQFSALRFVALIDRLYDYRVRLRVSARCPLRELFSPEYRDWAFAKRYRRCLSRLEELCREGAA